MCFRCFSSKKQGKNFEDGSAPKQNKPAEDKKAAPAVDPSPATSSTAKSSAMSSPKVAIVIYSMYGHIAKSECGHQSCYEDGRLSVFTVAETVKAGVESAGGQATIFQCVDVIEGCSSR